jgi:hypothetical protein
MTYVVALPEVSVDIIGTADQFLGLLPSFNFRWVGKLLLFQLLSHNQKKVLLVIVCV